MTTHLWLRFRFVLAMWALLTAAVFVLPAALGYDGHYDTTGYDGGEAAIDYDAVPVLATSNENADATGEGVLFAKFTEFLAAKGTPTTIYRAVGPNELADIGAAGGRYRVRPGGTEGKYFFETPEQASNFARMMGDKPYTTTSVQVSPSQLGRGQPINPAREGPSYFFSTPDVPSGPVNVFNHSVLP